MPTSLRSDYPINRSDLVGHFPAGSSGHFHRNTHPTKAVVYGTGAVGLGVLAVAVAAPYAISATGVSAFATGTLGGLAALNGAAQYGWDAAFNNKK